MNYNLINVIAPLIGVLIGGLLTFFSTFFVELIKERRDRKKRKFLLKYELIGGIHAYDLPIALCILAASAI